MKEFRTPTTPETWCSVGADHNHMATRCVGLGRGALVGLRRSAQVSQVCRSLRPLSDASERLCLGRPDFQAGVQVRGPVAATCDVSTSLSKRATIAISCAPRWWWPADCRSRAVSLSLTGGRASTVLMQATSARRAHPAEKSARSCILLSLRIHIWAHNDSLIRPQVPML